MQLTTEQFHKNLLATLSEVAQGNSVPNQYKLIITPIKEPHAKHNSLDDYMRLALLTDENIVNKFHDISDVVSLLSGPNSSYPLWVDVLPAKRDADFHVFELKTSMRFRKPSELQNKETGHPPFKAVHQVDFS